VRGVGAHEPVAQQGDRVRPRQQPGEFAHAVGQRGDRVQRAAQQVGSRADRGDEGAEDLRLLERVGQELGQRVRAAGQQPAGRDPRERRAERELEVRRGS
jgi:hypothetical protein